MSQAGSVIDGGGLIGDVRTLTGNDAVPVGPDGAGNINVVGFDPAVVTITNTAANTLTVTLVNVVVDTQQTVGLQTLACGAISIPINTAASLTCEILGVKDDFSAAISGIVQCSARNDGGGAVLVGNPSFFDTSVDFPLISTVTFDLAINAGDLELQVTGEMGSTINWKSKISALTL